MAAVLLVLAGCGGDVEPSDAAQEPPTEKSAEASSEPSPDPSTALVEPKEKIDCAKGYSSGVMVGDPQIWLAFWNYLLQINGQAAAAEQAAHLADSIGELAEDDHACQPLMDFNAHLEDIENLTLAGERIPQSKLRKTAAAGDEWLTAINEKPVFVS